MSIYNEIEMFERKWSVVLPSDYKEMLIKMANNEINMGECKVDDDPSVFLDKSLPDTFLRNEFPHNNSWDDPHAEGGYYSSEHITGSIPIWETGCGGFNLLVVSGPLRGQVWHDDRACSGKGIWPLYSKAGERLDIQSYADGLMDYESFRAPRA